MFEESSEWSFEDLSPRERQILALASEGLTDKEIAVRLGLSLTTIRTYWERLRVKTGASNRTASVASYVRAKAADDELHSEQVEIPVLIQAAIDATVGGIVVLGADRVIIVSNEKACTLLRRPIGSLDGVPIHHIIPRKHRALHRVLETAAEEPADGVFTVTSFVEISPSENLLANITVRTLDGPLGRHTVLFIQDFIAEADARRRGEVSGLTERLTRIILD